MKFLLFLFSFTFISSVVAAARLTCQQHFQKMYTTSDSKLALERNLALCHEVFNAYLKDNAVLDCTDTVDLFCKTLTKSQIRVENYSYNPIKAAAMLQGGYALGMAGATGIMNLFSPPLEVPKPTTAKRKENAQKQMTESECLHQVKAEGVVGYRYQASNKRCYVTDCEKGYVKSQDHSICVFKAEEECLVKNDDSYAKANAAEHVMRWGYGRGLDESADCYIAQCVSGWSPNTYGTECEKDMDPEIIVKKKEKKVVKSSYGVGGGSDNDAFYKSANAMSDNFNLASSYSFRGYSPNVYFTRHSTAAAGKPDGSPLETSRIGGMYGMRKLSWEPNWRPHKGLDLSCSTGTPIYATGDGKVLSAGYAGGCGLAVQIEHDDGIHKTRYCHLSQMKVSNGQSVSRGTVIGLCGSTGNSSGSHLHYEVKENWYLKNPYKYLTGGREL
ncbi:MAG: M23 family metallopeptidase [Alphaproteobacteria bacterium]|nr:M23 family metallopeptidase [Alphaproteobacteria bacterium]MBN2779759.1 M23 family metallopeptidase [Alphaproteobacteria bacterium]